MRAAIVGVRDDLARFGFDIEALGATKRGIRAARPTSLVATHPVAVPLDLRSTGRDDQRDGLQHLPGGHRDARLPRRELVPRLHSFLLSVIETSSGMPRPTVALELADWAASTTRGASEIADRLRDGLTGAEHRLSLVDRRIPRRDAPDRHDVSPRRGAVRSGRHTDQAASDHPDAGCGVTGVGADHPRLERCEIS